MTKFSEKNGKSEVEAFLFLFLLLIYSTVVEQAVFVKLIIHGGLYATPPRESHDAPGVQ